MAMEGDADCIHGINLDYSNCLICEGRLDYKNTANRVIESLISDQSFDGYCPTCGQCYQEPINRFWQRLCILFGVTGLIFGGGLGWLLAKLTESF